MTYADIVLKQRECFLTNQTKDIAFRKTQLGKLKAALQKNEKALYEAIYSDFQKSEFETYGSELSFIYQAIDTATKQLKHWAAPKKVKTNLVNFPARSYILPEPLGVCLVIGAWNYPYLLSFLPAISAIAAGNTVILKPSEIPAATSAVISKIINTHFDSSHFYVVEGGVTETTALLEQRFDKIFFTGSTKVGQIVYAAAAKHLTPVTLELGGKSPAIVTKDCNIEEAARRISWGKFLNAGQTCIAPDYVLVDQAIHDIFLEKLVQYTRQYQYGPAAENYVQIINEKNFDRLAALADNQTVFMGGEKDRASRYFAPTLLTNVRWDDPVMQEEIFGPILPVLEYTDLASTLALLKQHDKPLAFYLFTNDKITERLVLQELSFGGGAINDTLMHFSNPHLPYGGVGASGMGCYHDHWGFKAFSHYKSILKKPLWFETDLKYPPYSQRKFRWLKFLLSK